MLKGAEEVGKNVQKQKTLSSRWAELFGERKCVAEVMMARGAIWWFGGLVAGDRFRGRSSRALLLEDSLVLVNLHKRCWHVIDWLGSSPFQGRPFATSVLVSCGQLRSTLTAPADKHHCHHCHHCLRYLYYRHYRHSHH